MMQGFGRVIFADGKYKYGWFYQRELHGWGQES